MIYGRLVAIRLTEIKSYKLTNVMSGPRLVMHVSVKHVPPVAIPKIPGRCCACQFSKLLLRCICRVEASGAIRCTFGGWRRCDHSRKSLLARKVGIDCNSALCSHRSWIPSSVATQMIIFSFGIGSVYVSYGGGRGDSIIGCLLTSMRIEILNGLRRSRNGCEFLVNWYVLLDQYTEMAIISSSQSKGSDDWRTFHCDHM